MILTDVIIKEYNEDYRIELEKFRRQTILEGNTSLVSDKFNPEALDGKIWCAYIDNELASISAVERSHYTEDPDIAARVCRYHILKKFRHSHCGFKMLPLQIKWARENNFKILYWTHDIKNKPLNALYQHKKKMTDKESKKYFEADWYKQLKTDYRWLFKVSKNPNDNFYQYVYYIDLQNENYEWIPKSCAVWYNHDGNIKDELHIVSN